MWSRGVPVSTWYHVSHVSICEHVHVVERRAVRRRVDGARAEGEDGRDRDLVVGVDEDQVLKEKGARGSTWEHVGARGITWGHVGARGSTWEHVGSRGGTWGHVGA
eukprot:239699-Prymnesium_polylepis.1